MPELPDDHDGLYGITVHPLSDFQNRKAATWRTFIFCASVRPTRVANGLWGIGGREQIWPGNPKMHSAPGFCAGETPQTGKQDLDHYGWLSRLRNLIVSVGDRLLLTKPPYRLNVRFDPLLEVIFGIVTQMFPCPRNIKDTVSVFPHLFHPRDF